MKTEKEIFDLYCKKNCVFYALKEERIESIEKTFDYQLFRLKIRFSEFTDELKKCFKR